MPMRKPKPAASPKEREVARKPRKPRARKSAERPLRRAAPSAPVFYRKSRPAIEINAPFFHLHLRGNR